jgi:hypothetical protein
MALNPFTLKQMKDGTLSSLRLQGQQLDEKDLRMIGNYLRTTQTLKEFDLSYMAHLIDQFAEPLKQNRSVTKLGLGQAIQDHNVGTLIDIIKSNPAISEINLSNSYLQGSGVSQLARAIKANPHITHLSMEGVNRDNMGNARVETVTRTLKDNPNILRFTPETDETERICAANEAAARHLLGAAIKAPEKLAKEDIEAITLRLPAILYIAQQDTLPGRREVAQLLVNIEDAAQKTGAAFAIPERFADVAAEMPRPFKPDENKVDFAALTPGMALDKPAALPRLYQAAEAGQVEELLAHMKQNGVRLTAEHCLIKPEGKHENFIEVVARQGKLAAVMTPEVWQGDPRGLKTVTEAVPAREWKRQLKELPAERLIYQVNALSFKQAHKPQAKPGPSLG